MNQVLGNCEKLMVWMYRYRLQTIIGRAITTAHSCFAFLLPMAAVSFLLGPSLVIPISRSSSSVIVSRWAKSISCSRKISRYFSRPVDIFVPFLLNWIYSAINEFWKCGIRYVDHITQVFQQLCKWGGILRGESPVLQHPSKLGGGREGGQRPRGVTRDDPGLNI